MSALAGLTPDIRQLPRRLTAAGAVAGAALFAAFVVGVLIAHGVAFGLGLAAGLCFLAVAAISLPMAVVLWLPLVFLERLPLAGAQTAAGLLILVAWVGGLRPVRSPLRVLLRVHRNTLVLMLATLGWMTLSLTWATDRHAAWVSLVQWYAAAAIFLVLVTTIAGEQLARLALWGVVVGALLSVVTGLVIRGAAPPGLTGGVQHGPERFGGAWGDPNFLAAGLVPAMALAAFIAIDASHRVRLAIVALLVPSILGFAAAGSRGAVIAAAAALVSALVLARGRRTQILVALVVVFVPTVVWLAAHPDTFERVTAFGGQGNGRTTLWTVGLRMWAAHALLGVGNGNFSALSAGYLMRPGLLTYTGFIVVSPLVVHNTYIQLLAETGVVGLGLYCATVCACLRASWQAVSLFTRQRRLGLAWAARGVLVAATSMLVAFFFLSAPTDKRLWVLFALGPILHATALEGTQREPHRR